MFCTQCGAENDDLGSFCKSCGVSIASQIGKSVSFVDSISLAFTNYVNFKGRSTRSEYWWFSLFYAVVSISLTIIDALLLGATEVLPGIWGLIVIIPYLSLGFRRLHDINMSGFWGFIWVPGFVLYIILEYMGLWWLGTIAVIASVGTVFYWLIQPSDKGSNNYGMGEHTKLE